MITDPTTEHPAFIPSLVEKLRRPGLDESIAEALEIIFRYAPPFQLVREPVDEWQYVEDLVAIVMGQELATASFVDEQFAFAVGISIGEGLVMHRRG